MKAAFVVSALLSLAAASPMAQSLNVRDTTPSRILASAQNCVCDASSCVDAADTCSCLNTLAAQCESTQAAQGCTFTVTCSTTTTGPSTPATTTSAAPAFSPSSDGARPWTCGSFTNYTCDTTNEHVCISDLSRPCNDANQDSCTCQPRCGRGNPCDAGYTCVSGCFDGVCDASDFCKPESS